MPHLPWPTEAATLSVEPFRPVLERLQSLALRHSDHVDLLAPLIDEDGTPDPSADPPPALAQVLEEFGGIRPRGGPELNLLVDERTDEGPYTLLPDRTSYYPLIEGDDAAVILTIDESGAPGAVYGIGEDLALTLAAEDLLAFLERYTGALELTLDALDAEVVRSRGADGLGDAARDEITAELMDVHLYRTILGDIPEEECAPIPLVPAKDSDLAGDDLPAGTLALADTRDAALDFCIPVMDADLPGDPLETSLAWRHDGRVVLLVDAAAART
ncbi:MAG: hypothetical protein Q4G40_05790 [Brachybacterium sp.]|nr:hypothetical protein [Brachybacterium sp.]